MQIVFVEFLPREILLSFKRKISGLLVWATDVSFAQTSSELFCVLWTTLLSNLFTILI